VPGHSEKAVIRAIEETMMMKTRIRLSRFLILGALLLLGCGPEEAGDGEARGIPVRTVNVFREEVSIPVHTSGKLALSAEARLSFKIGGIVGRIPVDEGEAVASGGLIAELKGDEINAQVAQARSGFEKAGRALERARRLYRDSVATLEQLQDAETGYEVAKAGLEIAEFNRTYSSIYAPSDGKVLKIFVEPNELVGPGMPVVLFGSSGKVWKVRAGVADRDVIRLSLGDSADVAFDAYPDRGFAARVVEIGEAADPLSGVYEVELALDDGGAKLVSGFVARVDIHPSMCEPMAVIPIEALVEADAEEGYVYVPDQTGRAAEKMAVTLGCILGDKVAVRSGLDDTDRVITDGAAYLTDRSAIRIVDEMPGAQ
jgi:multidrug efflux system membrane fusion protein